MLVSYSLPTINWYMLHLLIDFSSIMKFAVISEAFFTDGFILKCSKSFVTRLNGDDYFHIYCNVFFNLIFHPFHEN